MFFLSHRFRIAAGIFFMTTVLAILGFLLIKVSSIPVAGVSVNYDSHEAEMCREYLSSYGWETLTDPVEVSRITVPFEFDDTYNEYNGIQKSQGYDLSVYKGRECIKYVFVVLNYPDNAFGDSVRADVLTCEGTIVGGDICSLRIDGFMHGFRYENR